MALVPSIPTYFLAPNCDFPPDGLISLGSIIVDPKTPQQSLNHRNNQRVKVSADDLQESFKDNWEDTIESVKHNKITLWTSFMQMILGISADLSTGLTHEKQDRYKFHRLETKYFEPDVAYIEESLKAEGVRAYISATRYKKPIYMVTGVKIARGASVLGKIVKASWGVLKAGLDATMLIGVPVSGGPQIERRSAKERGATFEHGSDYVFAYRVIKIWLKKDGNVKMQKQLVTTV